MFKGKYFYQMILKKLKLIKIVYISNYLIFISNN